MGSVKHFSNAEANREPVRDRREGENHYNTVHSSNSVQCYIYCVCVTVCAWCFWSVYRTDFKDYKSKVHPRVIFQRYVDEFNDEVRRAARRDGVT